MSVANYTYDVTMFKDTFEHQFTYINGFLRNTHRFANKNAVTCPIREKSWTYAELDLVVNKLANAMFKDGVQRNDLVMYQLFNCAEFIFSYLAPQKIGAINCPINFRLSSGETAFILDDSRPKVFIYDAELGEMVEKALAMAKHKPERVVMVNYADTSISPIPGAISFDDYISGMPDIAPKVFYQAHIYDEVTRLYTSGTTGMPKAVPKNNINEIMCAHDAIMHFPVTPVDKNMNMTPWFHAGGLHSGGPCPVLYAGAETVALRNFDADLVLDYIEKYSLTFIIGAPPTLKMIHDKQIAQPRNLSTLSGIVTMGAPLEKEACIKYQKVLTPRIFNGYGTTETFWNTFLRPYDLPHKAGSTGRAVTDDDVAVVKVYPDRLAEPDDYVAKDNQEAGEVIFRPAGKTSFTYINQPDQAKKRFYKGWVYSGDLATWDENEYVTIMSRKDDMLISGGENVYPVQVEEAINENPKIEDSVVVGLKDDKWGQIICAYVVKKDPSLTAKELNEFCVQHPMLARFKRPRYYRFVDKLPFTATGKKVHYKVAEMVQQDYDQGLLEEV